MDSLYELLNPASFSDLLGMCVAQVVGGLGLGFAAALLGLLISVPVRVFGFKE